MRVFIFASLALFVACGDSQPVLAPTPASSTETAPAADVNAQIEAAIRKHLDRRGDLDLSAMDLTIERVEVEGNSANATIGFRVKDTPEAAMSMDYELVKDGGDWAVQPKPAAPHTAPPSQGLPPGHPPAGGEPAQPLPPGHPPVAQ